MKILNYLQERTAVKKYLSAVVSFAIFVYRMELFILLHSTLVLFMQKNVRFDKIQN